MKKQVTTLQKDGKEQLQLEQEAQDALEYLTGQVHALSEVRRRRKLTSG